MEGYVITTHLIDNPKITFYYRGTANEEGVSFAMNTIVGFDISDAMVFHDKEDAIQLCEKLNRDKEGLLKNGFETFIMQKTRASHY
jgi:hypothetical protein